MFALLFYTPLVLFPCFSKLQPLFEPDPEFRTEAPAVAVAARKVPVEQVPVPVGPKSHWMQEPLHESRETKRLYAGSGLVLWWFE